MIEHIYNIAAEYMIMIIMLLVAHYIFLEPFWKKWQRVFYVGSFLFIAAGEFCLQSDMRMLLCILLAGVYFYGARKKHRLGGFFLIFPVWGICSGFLYPILIMPKLLFLLQEEQLQLYNVVIDFVTLLCLICFACMGRKWRENFQNEMQYRSLQKWESGLLKSTGVLLLGMEITMEEYAGIATLSFNTRIYMGIGSVASLFLTISIICLVQQGNKRAYYYGIAKLQEQYLEAEVKHFEAYQNTQIETRRIRHDMKNHMAAMCYLAKEKKWEELEDYLQNLGSEIENIDAELHCGNTFVDAILNEKYQMAKQLGIAFEIEGNFPGQVNIRNVDLCTIFANALDNVIEALENAPVEQRWMKLTIVSQGEMLLLRFVNPTYKRKNKELIGYTSKQTKGNHGFGLRNIELAAKNYQGEIKVDIKTEGEEGLFVLEVMLFNICI